MLKSVKVTFLVLIIITFSKFDVYAQFAGGSGTADDPYLVETANHLNNVRDYLGANFRQIANIDLDVAPYNSGYGWQPISIFTGVYDGQELIISNLYINRPSSGNTGLFGRLEYAETSNVRVENVNVIGDEQVGGLAGDTLNSIFYNCSVTGNVTGILSVGGLVGRSSGSVSNSLSSGSVIGDRRVGGLVGWCMDPILNSYSLANVSGNEFVGGLIGYASNYTQITNSYYNYESITINGNYSVVTFGALGEEQFTAWLDNNFVLSIENYLVYDGGEYVISTIENLRHLLAFIYYVEYNFKLNNDIDLISESNFYIPHIRGNFDGQYHKILNLNINLPEISHIGFFGFVYGDISNINVENVDIVGDYAIGGIIGKNSGTISNSYSTGSVSGNKFVGGVVGVNYNGISKCYSLASVEGDYFIGGLVGSNNGEFYYGDIDDCYSSGDVLGNFGVGGLVGSNNCGSISNSYSRGNVSGNINVGGLIGGDSYGHFTNNYWNIETSGQTISAGGEGRTTLEMTYPHSANTYVDWDFETTWQEDIDNINNGYPYLFDTAFVDIDNELMIISHDLYIQNYPNPFNPETTIQFNLETNSQVNLSIYNIKGELVKNIVNGIVLQGEKSYIWNGNNNNNELVSSGIYLCKLFVDHKFVKSRKMTLLK